MTGASGEVLFEAPRATREISSRELNLKARRPADLPRNHAACLRAEVPTFPREIEDRIDQYLVRQAALRSARDTVRPPSFDDGLLSGPRPGTPAVDTKVQ